MMQLPSRELLAERLYAAFIGSLELDEPHPRWATPWSLLAPSLRRQWLEVADRALEELRAVPSA